MELRSRLRVKDAQGFSFIELLVALAATVIVMGVVFGLLAQGSGAHTRELERADLQAQARAALQMISQDVLLAGGDLPPEIPAFRPRTHEGDLSGMEMVGNFEDDARGGGAIPVLSFDGHVVRLGGDPVRFRRGDLVLVYDDEPTGGKWMFGLVDSVDVGALAEVTLLTHAGARVDDVDVPIALPATIDSYNRPTPESGFLTPVTVIGYGLDSDLDAPDLVRSSLWRQVNWGESVDVAYVEDLGIRYFVGGTVAEPRAPTSEPRVPVPSIHGQGKGPTPRADSQGVGRMDRGARGRTNAEREIDLPPVPQPEPSTTIAEKDLIRGVRITVTARSQTGNLRGSRLKDGQGPTEQAYLRETLSTRVAPRNLLIQAERRKQQLDSAH